MALWWSLGCFGISISYIVYTVVPPNTAFLGTGCEGVYCIISKKPYLGLEMGGGMWREAVLGGAILGGTTVLFKL